MAGFLGAFVIIASLVYGQWSYFVIFFALALFSLWEFYRLMKLQNYLPIRVLGVIIGGLMFVFSFLIESQNWNSNYYYALFPLASLSLVVKLYKKTDNNPIINIAIFYLGITYVALPFALMNMVVFHGGGYGYKILLGLLLIIWASDTGAYFAGTFFGKTKLFQRISPKKSWEGLVGGAIMAVLFAFIMSRYHTDLYLWEWLVVAAIVVVVGTYGDLVESLFKRSMEIKDSGASIPGHGGFLDRFDSLILSIPFIVVFLKLFN
ncbi:phosphatidate cytidylyltransferase [Marinoscillum sp. MHG1-6]|uniref:phosphatidate cytidylyltransferase n=1 Tax=Marinoscillum sp. MHG1-6 TaxID=2959627 RepID=UPI00215819C0|nr:phosphatidate cytidylyltransferase [Marinoscillum sp. MHG1-6]